MSGASDSRPVRHRLCEIEMELSLEGYLRAGGPHDPGGMEWCRQ